MNHAQNRKINEKPTSSGDERALLTCPARSTPRSQRNSAHTMSCCSHLKRTRKWCKSPVCARSRVIRESSEQPKLVPLIVWARPAAFFFFFLGLRWSPTDLSHVKWILAESVFNSCFGNLCLHKAHTRVMYMHSCCLCSNSLCLCGW